MAGQDEISGFADEIPLSVLPTSTGRPRQAGGMLALRWNTLPGSYSALILASLSYLAVP